MAVVAEGWDDDWDDVSDNDNAEGVRKGESDLLESTVLSALKNEMERETLSFTTSPSKSASTQPPAFGQPILAQPTPRMETALVKDAVQTHLPTIPFPSFIPASSGPGPSSRPPAPVNIPSAGSSGGSSFEAVDRWDVQVAAAESSEAEQVEAPQKADGWDVDGDQFFNVIRDDHSGIAAQHHLASRTGPPAVPTKATDRTLDLNPAASEADGWDSGGDFFDNLDAQPTIGYEIEAAPVAGVQMWQSSQGSAAADSKGRAHVGSSLQAVQGSASEVPAGAAAAATEAAVDSCISQGYTRVSTADQASTLVAAHHRDTIQQQPLQLPSTAPQPPASQQLQPLTPEHQPATPGQQLSHPTAALPLPPQQSLPPVPVPQLSQQPLPQVLQSQLPPAAPQQMSFTAGIEPPAAAAQPPAPHPVGTTATVMPPTGLPAVAQPPQHASTTQVSDNQAADGWDDGFFDGLEAAEDDLVAPAPPQEQPLLSQPSNDQDLQPAAVIHSPQSSSSGASESTDSSLGVPSVPSLASRSYQGLPFGPSPTSQVLSSGALDGMARSQGAPSGPPPPAGGRPPLPQRRLGHGISSQLLSFGPTEPEGDSSTNLFDMDARDTGVEEWLGYESVEGAVPSSAISVLATAGIIGLAWPTGTPPWAAAFAAPAQAPAAPVGQAAVPATPPAAPPERSASLAALAVAAVASPGALKADPASPAAPLAALAIAAMAAPGVLGPSPAGDTGDTTAAGVCPSPPKNEVTSTPATQLSATPSVHGSAAYALPRLSQPAVVDESNQWDDAFDDLDLDAPGPQPAVGYSAQAVAPEAPPAAVVEQDTDESPGSTAGHELPPATESAAAHGRLSEAAEPATAEEAAGSWPHLILARPEQPAAVRASEPSFGWGGSHPELPAPAPQAVADMAGGDAVPAGAAVDAATSEPAAAGPPPFTAPVTAEAVDNWTHPFPVARVEEEEEVEAAHSQEAASSWSHPAAEVEGAAAAAGSTAAAGSWTTPSPLAESVGVETTMQPPMPAAEAPPPQQAPAPPAFSYVVKTRGPFDTASSDDEADPFGSSFGGTSSSAPPAAARSGITPPSFAAAIPVPPVPPQAAAAGTTLVGSPQIPPPGAPPSSSSLAPPAALQQDQAFGADRQPPTFVSSAAQPEFNNAAAPGVGQQRSDSLESSSPPQPTGGPPHAYAAGARATELPHAAPHVPHDQAPLQSTSVSSYAAEGASFFDALSTPGPAVIPSQPPQLAHTTTPLPIPTTFPPSTPSDGASFFETLPSPATPGPASGVPHTGQLPAAGEPAESLTGAPLTRVPSPPPSPDDLDADLALGAISFTTAGIVQYSYSDSIIAEPAATADTQEVDAQLLGNSTSVVNETSRQGSFTFATPSDVQPVQPYRPPGPSRMGGTEGMAGSGFSMIPPAPVVTLPGQSTPSGPSFGMQTAPVPAWQPLVPSAAPFADSGDSFFDDAPEEDGPANSWQPAPSASVSAAFPRQDMFSHTQPAQPAAGTLVVDSASREQHAAAAAVPPGAEPAPAASSFQVRPVSPFAGTAEDADSFFDDVPADATSPHLSARPAAQPALQPSTASDITHAGSAHLSTSISLLAPTLQPSFQLPPAAPEAPLWPPQAPAFHVTTTAPFGGAADATDSFFDSDIGDGAASTSPPPAPPASISFGAAPAAQLAPYSVPQLSAAVQETAVPQPVATTYHTATAGVFAAAHSADAFFETELGDPSPAASAPAAAPFRNAVAPGPFQPAVSPAPFQQGPSQPTAATQPLVHASPAQHAVRSRGSSQAGDAAESFFDGDIGGDDANLPAAPLAPVPFQALPSQQPGAFHQAPHTAPVPQPFQAQAQAQSPPQLMQTAQPALHIAAAGPFHAADSFFDDDLGAAPAAAPAPGEAHAGAQPGFQPAAHAAGPPAYHSLTAGPFQAAGPADSFFESDLGGPVPFQPAAQQAAPVAASPQSAPPAYHSLTAAPFQADSADSFFERDLGGGALIQPVPPPPTDRYAAVDTADSFFESDHGHTVPAQPALQSAVPPPLPTAHAAPPAYYPSTAGPFQADDSAGLFFESDVGGAAPFAHQPAPQSAIPPPPPVPYAAPPAYHTGPFQASGSADSFFESDLGGVSAPVPAPALDSTHPATPAPAAPHVAPPAYHTPATAPFQVDDPGDSFFEDDLGIAAPPAAPQQQQPEPQPATHEAPHTPAPYTAPLAYQTPAAGPFQARESADTFFQNDLGDAPVPFQQHEAHRHPPAPASSPPPADAVHPTHLTAASSNPLVGDAPHSFFRDGPGDDHASAPAAASSQPAAPQPSHAIHQSPYPTFQLANTVPFQNDAESFFDDDIADAASIGPAAHDTAHAPFKGAAPAPAPGQCAPSATSSTPSAGPLQDVVPAPQPGAYAQPATFQTPSARPGQTDDRADSFFEQGPGDAATQQGVAPAVQHSTPQPPAGQLQLPHPPDQQSVPYSVPQPAAAFNVVSQAPFASGPDAADSFFETDLGDGTPSHLPATSFPAASVPFQPAMELSPPDHAPFPPGPITAAPGDAGERPQEQSYSAPRAAHLGDQPTHAAGEAGAADTSAAQHAQQPAEAAADVVQSPEEAAAAAAAYYAYYGYTYDASAYSAGGATDAHAAYAAYYQQQQTLAVGGTDASHTGYDGTTYQNNYAGSSTAYNGSHYPGSAPYDASQYTAQGSAPYDPSQYAAQGSAPYDPSQYAAQSSAPYDASQYSQGSMPYDTSQYGLQGSAAGYYPYGQAAGSTAIDAGTFQGSSPAAPLYEQGSWPIQGSSRGSSVTSQGVAAGAPAQWGAPGVYQVPRHHSPRKGTHPATSAVVPPPNVYGQVYRPDPVMVQRQVDATLCPTTQTQAMHTPNGRPPGALVSFGLGGKLVLMQPFPLNPAGLGDPANYPMGSGKLRIVDMATVPASLSASYDHTPPQSTSAKPSATTTPSPPLNPLVELLNSFPGPITKDTPKDKLQKFLADCAERAEQEVAENGGNADSRRTQWDVLRIMAKHGVPLRPQQGGKVKEGEGYEAELYKALLGAAQQDGGTAAVLAAVPSEGQLQAAAQEVQGLLLAGRRAEALRVAVAGQLWGQALLLASSMDNRTFQETAAAMGMRSTAAGPLRTLCLCMAGRPDLVHGGVLPAAEVAAGHQGSGSNRTSLFSVLGKALKGTAAAEPDAPQEQAQAPQMDLDILRQWQRHLAIMATNRTPNDVEAMAKLGDRLMQETRQVDAAHVCYMLAGRPLQPCDPDSRLVLLGADPKAHPSSAFASVLALQRSEVYDYLLQGGQAPLNPVTVPYKLLYASLLAEWGQVPAALRYCEVMHAGLKALGPKIPARLLPVSQQLEALRQRLAYHASVHRISAARTDGQGGITGMMKLLGKALDAVMGGPEETLLRQQQLAAAAAQVPGGVPLPNPMMAYAAAQVVGSGPPSSSGGISYANPAFANSMQSLPDTFHSIPPSRNTSHNTLPGASNLSWQPSMTPDGPSSQNLNPGWPSSGRPSTSFASGPPSSSHSDPSMGHARSSHPPIGQMDGGLATSMGQTPYGTPDSTPLTSATPSTMPGGYDGGQPMAAWPANPQHSTGGNGYTSNAPPAAGWAAGAQHSTGAGGHTGSTSWPGGAQHSTSTSGYDAGVQPTAAWPDRVVAAGGAQHSVASSFDAGVQPAAWPGHAGSQYGTPSSSAPHSTHHTAVLPQAGIVQGGADGYDATSSGQLLSPDHQPGLQPQVPWNTTQQAGDTPPQMPLSGSLSQQQQQPPSANLLSSPSGQLAAGSSQQERATSGTGSSQLEPAASQVEAAQNKARGGGGAQMTKSSSNSGKQGGWFKSLIRTVVGGKDVRQDVPELENEFYYDEVAKRWRMRGEPDPDPAEAAAMAAPPIVPPPPPKATEASGPPSGPRLPGGQGVPPPPAGAAGVQRTRGSLQSRYVNHMTLPAGGAAPQAMSAPGRPTGLLPPGAATTRPGGLVPPPNVFVPPPLQPDSGSYGQLAADTSSFATPGAAAAVGPSGQLDSPAVPGGQHMGRQHSSGQALYTSGQYSDGALAQQDMYATGQQSAERQGQYSAGQYSAGQQDVSQGTQAEYQVNASNDFQDIAL